MISMLLRNELPTNPDNPRDWRKLAVKFAAAAAALSTMAGLNACASDRAEPSKTPTPSASTIDSSPRPSHTPLNAKPFEEYSPVDPSVSHERTEQQIAELAEISALYREEFADQISEKEIPAGLSDEEFATEFNDRLSEWWNAGFDDDPRFLEKVDFLKRSGYERTEGSYKVTQDPAFEYANALFEKNWEENPNLVYQFDAGHQANAWVANSVAGIIWNPNAPRMDDGTPFVDYRVQTQLEGVSSVSNFDGTRVLDVSFSAGDEHGLIDRGDINIGEARQVEGFRHGGIATYRIGFTEQDGRVVISNIEIIS